MPERMRISAKFIADKPKNIRKSVVELLITRSTRLSIAPNKINTKPDDRIIFLFQYFFNKLARINIIIMDITIVSPIGIGILKAMP
ncbi:hypothetical protein L6260_02640 [Candidatus Parcubacteria bacterium]|nr:hypothetical protein [Candidatus Parcubacteria bacterium]